MSKHFRMSVEDLIENVEIEKKSLEYNIDRMCEEFEKTQNRIVVLRQELKQVTETLERLNTLLPGVKYEEKDSDVVLSGGGKPTLE